MGSFDDLCKVGEDMLGDVTKATSTGNFDGLSSKLRMHAEDAADIMRTGVQNAINTNAANNRTNYTNQQTQGFKYNVNANQIYTPNGQRVTNYLPYGSRTPFMPNKVRNYAGIGQAVFGLIGSLSLLPMFIMSLINLFSASSVGEAAAYIFLIIFFGCFAGLLRAGISSTRLINTYQKYGRILGNSEYFKIEDLAKAADVDPAKLLKQLKKFKKKGFVRNMRFDMQETTCMLTDRAYQQYVNAENSRIERERQEALQAERTSALPDNAQRVIEEGRAYVKHIRDVNDRIPDTDEMSNKLYKLEAISNRIFAQVEKQPESAEDLRKFMSYYLPTTEKLLNAYYELYSNPSAAGTNVENTKAEIESAVDTINEAYEKLLDSLFQDMSVDISSDISVMKTMMAQDGLTKEKVFENA